MKGTYQYGVFFTFVTRIVEFPVTLTQSNLVKQKLIHERGVTNA